MRAPGNIRRGFTIVWVLVTIAIIATVAAAASPMLVTVDDAGRVSKTADLLTKVANGVDSFNLLAKRGGPSFTTPHRLSQLVLPIFAGDSAGCTTQTYNATAQTNWATWAPFSVIYVPDDGLWTPIGRLSDVPSRTSATEGTVRTSTSDPYFIQMPSVDVVHARMLDMLVDGGDTPSSGTVQYTAVRSDSTVLLSYQVVLAHSPAC